MRRTMLALLLSLLIPALLGLALAPAAVADDGVWAWGAPYVDTTLRMYDSVAPGPGLSFYVGGGGMDQWTVTRIDTSGDTSGSTFWTDTRLGPDSTGAELGELTSDAARNLYAIGHDATHGGDIYIVKYSKDSTQGNPVVSWQKSWDGPKHTGDWSYAAAVAKGGDLLVAGSTGYAGGTGPETDAVLLRYSPAGKLRWKYIMSSSSYDAFQDLAVDGKGNAYVTGNRAGTQLSSQMVTLKIDATGHRVWQRSISGLGIRYYGEYLKVKGSSVYVAGEFSGGYENRPAVVRYSLAGKQAWAWTDIWSIDGVNDMTVDGKGRLVLVGTQQQGFGPDQFTAGFLYFISPSGSMMEQSVWLSAENWTCGLIPWSVTTDSNDQVWLTGEWHTNQTGTEGSAVVVKVTSIDTASTVAYQRVWRLDGPAGGADCISGLLMQPDNGTFAVGYEHGPGGHEAIADRLTP
jgi:hypothetical protein